MVAALFSSPMYYIYCHGGMTASSTTSYLSYFTLGNIGQTQWYCAQSNILSPVVNGSTYENKSSLILQCPGGSNVTELLELGLARTDYTTNQTYIQTNNTCPNVNFNTGYDGIHLELDPDCSWYWSNRTRGSDGRAIAGPPWAAQEQNTSHKKNKHMKAFDCAS